VKQCTQILEGVTDRRDSEEVLSIFREHISLFQAEKGRQVGSGHQRNDVRIRINIGWIALTLLHVENSTWVRDICRQNEMVSCLREIRPRVITCLKM
jgi:hypothetical protein